MHADRRDVAEALASGVLAFAWYALPDAVASRRARAAAKTALLVPMVVMGVAQARREAASPDAREGAAAASDVLARIRDLTRAEPVLDQSVLEPTGAADGTGAPGDRNGRPGLLGGLPSPGQTAAIAAGLLVVAVTVVGSAAAERGVHRYGQRLGARGVRLPHTRIGAVAGVGSAALALAAAELAARRP